MKVRLLTRWNGYVSNDIVSVSEARAEMLESQGIGRIIDRPATVGVPEADKLEPKARKK